MSMMHVDGWPSDGHYYCSTGKVRISAWSLEPHAPHALWGLHSAVTKSLIGFIACRVTLCPPLLRELLIVFFVEG